MNENNDYGILQNNIQNAESNARFISSMENERKRRAQSLKLNSNYTNLKYNEWLTLLNNFIYVEYNITPNIDFSVYQFSKTELEFQFLNGTEIRSIINQTDRLNAILDNISSQFIRQLGTRPAILFDELLGFMNSFYENNNQNTSLEYNLLKDELKDKKALEIADIVLKHILNHLFKLPTNYKEGQSIKFIDDFVLFIGNHFPKRLENSSINDFKLPESAIDNIFHYPIAIKQENNLYAINVKESSNRFLSLIKSKYETITCMLRLMALGQPIEAVETISKQDITLKNIPTSPIQHIDEIGQDELNPRVEVDHPNLTFNYLDNEINNARRFIEKLLEKYDNHKLLICSFISEPFYIELFREASDLFNTFNFYKAFNLCRYIADKTEFNKNRLTIKGFHILDPIIEQKKQAEIKPLNNNNIIDTEIRIYRKANKTNLILLILGITTFTILVSVIVYKLYLRYKVNNQVIARTQYEAFQILNNSARNRSHTKRLRAIREKFGSKIKAF